MRKNQRWTKTKRLPLENPSGSLVKFKPGADLLSRTVASQVPSAQQGLTTVFGMGTGVAPAV